MDAKNSFSAQNIVINLKHEANEDRLNSIDDEYAAKKNQDATAAGIEINSFTNASPYKTTTIASKQYSQSDLFGEDKDAHSNIAETIQSQINQQLRRSENGYEYDRATLPSTTTTPTGRNWKANRAYPDV